MLRNMTRYREAQRKRAAVLLLAAAITLLDEEDRKSTRRWWVRPWFKRAEGALNLVQRNFDNDIGQFKQFLRINEDCFYNLLGMIENQIRKQDTHFRQAISPKEKLIVTLRFLATGESYRSLMYLFRISESTISIFIPQVCQAIYAALKETYLKMPKTAADWLNVAKDFESTWNLPNVIGAIDGKHVVFRAPRSAGSTYYNYKNEHSIVLLAVADARYKFLYIDVGTNGRVSDGGVFRESSLCRAMAQNALALPEDLPLPGRQRLTPYVFIADAAFPLSERIMKPFPFRNMTVEQRIFNYRLSRVRRVVENAFGILANRFRIFLTTINLAPEKVQVITLACCALHNYLRTECPTYVQNDEDADQSYVFRYGLNYQGANRPRSVALEIRQEFMEYVNNEGTVPWQYRAI